MVLSSIQVIWMVGCCIGSFLIIAVCFGLFEIFYRDVSGTSSEIKTISLPNEECHTRPTLINIGNRSNYYYPEIISLHRCGGACGHDKPTFRGCVVKTSNKIYVKVSNKVTSENKTVLLSNHTSCSCRCVHNSSVCENTQTWDEDKCKCGCKQPIKPSNCTTNYIWNPNFCKCECAQSCTHSRKDLNKINCSCECKPKYQKRCNRKNKQLNHSDCKCYTPALSAYLSCTALPMKWAVVLIAISFLAFCVAVFDCVLYCKSNCCIYTLTYICFGDSKNDKLKGKGRHEVPTSDEDD